MDEPVKRGRGRGRGAKARGGRGRGRGRGRGGRAKAAAVIESDDEHLQEEVDEPSTESIHESMVVKELANADEEKPQSPAATSVLPIESIDEKENELRTPTTIDMEADISQLEAPTFTTISRGPPEPMTRLKWGHKVNLIGEKVLNPMIHCCDQCENVKPILIYGRMIPCKHVFCLKCGREEPLKACPRCKEKVVRVEQSGLGTVFMCTHGGSRYGTTGCRRTYLSQRDLQAHINHRHVSLAAVPESKQAAAEAKAAAATAAANAQPQRKISNDQTGGGNVGRQRNSSTSGGGQQFGSNISVVQTGSVSGLPTGRTNLITIPIQDSQLQQSQQSSIPQLLGLGVGGQNMHQPSQMQSNSDLYYNSMLHQQPSYGSATQQSFAAMQAQQQVNNILSQPQHTRQPLLPAPNQPPQQTQSYFNQYVQPYTQMQPHYQQQNNQRQQYEQQQQGYGSNVTSQQQQQQQQQQWQQQQYYR